jgi:hypothetical protein
MADNEDKLFISEDPAAPTLQEEIDNALARQTGEMALLKLMHNPHLIVDHEPGSIVLIERGHFLPITSELRHISPERLIMRALHRAGHTSQVIFPQHACTWSGVAYLYLGKEDTQMGFGQVLMAGRSAPEYAGARVVIQQHAEDLMPKGDDDGAAGAASLHGLIYGGEAVKPSGSMVNVPFCVLRNDKSPAEGGTLLRRIRENSVTEKSIRENGWLYDQGSPMLAVEVAWTQEEWDAEIAAGNYGTGTPMPDPLRLRTWKNDGGGLANIVIPDKEWRMRRFIVVDGNHRAKIMNTMIKEEHPNAIERCARGCLLLDCDPVVDREKCMLSSMLANVPRDGTHNDGSDASDRVK